MNQSLSLPTQDGMNPNTAPLFFKGLAVENKIYRILTHIDSSLIVEYLESFEFAEDRIPVGMKMKEYCDKMTEVEFVDAFSHGKLMGAHLSSSEMEAFEEASVSFIESVQATSCSNC